MKYAYLCRYFTEKLNEMVALAITGKQIKTVTNLAKLFQGSPQFIHNNNNNTIYKASNAQHLTTETVI